MQELLSGSGDASSSLMRQIQALAEQASAAQASAAEQEQQLLGRLRSAEQAAAEATAAERDASGRAASAEAALQAAREAAAAAVQVCQMSWLTRSCGMTVNVCSTNNQAEGSASQRSVLLHAHPTSVFTT